MNAIQSAVDQLAQALTDADRSNDVVIDVHTRDRIQYTMRLLMETDEYKENQLKKTNIMRDNKLIAEFMGFPKLSDAIDERTTAYYIGDVIKANNENNENEDDVFHPEDMLFDSSWDWLMPIAERCLCTDEKTDGQHYFINDALLTCNIEVVFDRVVEFIKDYNKTL